MAKQVKRKSAKQVKKEFVSPFKIYWEKKNYIFLAAGMAAVVIGFYFMSLGGWDSTASLFISPIILFIAYFILFPASILYRRKNEPLEEKQVDTGKS